MKKETYHKYQKDNVTKTYKKVNRSTVSRINFESKKIPKKLAIDDSKWKLSKWKKQEAF